MKIYSIQPKSVNFQKNNNTIKTGKTTPETKKIGSKNSTKYIATALIAGTTASAITAALLIRKNKAKVLKDSISLGKTISDNLTDTIDLKKTLDTILTTDNKSLQLYSAINDPVSTKSLMALGPNYEILKKNEQLDISSFKLDYDPMNPPRNIITEYPKYHYILEPNYIPKKINTNSKTFIVPEFTENGKVEFRLPMTDAVIVKKEKLSKYINAYNVETNISEGYADSVNWSYEKIARDILQNFYDGHGHTLDGVKFEIEPQKNIFNKNKYRIKISGESEYTADKALLLGETQKKNDSTAAGNYGEGLKMSILKILKDTDADCINIGSANWSIKYNLRKSSLNAKKVLSYSLENIPKIEGNYLEFETSDTKLIDSFSAAINYFYHSGNKDFHNIDFENEFLGIKKLNEKEFGSLYIAGQKFEFKNNWQGLEGFNIFFKEKPPREILDISRDRLSLTEGDLPILFKYFTSKSNNEDKIEILNTMREYWDKGGISKNILDGIARGIQSSFIKIKFPEKYISLGFSMPNSNLIADLNSKGYKVCNSNFSFIGMENILNFLKKVRNHTPLNPTEIEIKKIAIMKKALAQFQNLHQAGKFTPTEMNPKIYLFNPESASESDLSRNYLAEAIIDYKNATTIGFWIDRNYINKSSFSDVLATTLHELTHKYGGDGTDKFSYALTDVLKFTIQSMVSNPKSLNELRKLSLDWQLINN